MGNNITIQEDRSLYGFNVGAVKMEKLYEGITNLTLDWHNVDHTYYHFGYSYFIFKVI